jgi:hypothetical protein
MLYPPFLTSCIFNQRNRMQKTFSDLTDSEFGAILNIFFPGNQKQTLTKGGGDSNSVRGNRRQAKQLLVRES